jgi:hypothetical protein
VEASLDRDWKSVLDSTAGIVYLGTPHYGLSTALLGMVRVLGKIADLFVETPDLLIKELFRDSQRLIELEDQLVSLIPHCQVMCFYETLKPKRHGSGVIVWALR